MGFVMHRAVYLPLEKAFFDQSRKQGEKWEAAQVFPCSLSHSSGHGWGLESPVLFTQGHFKANLLRFGAGQQCQGSPELEPEGQEGWRGQGVVGAPSATFSPQ